MKAKTIKAICASRIESLATYVDSFVIGDTEVSPIYLDPELGNDIRKGTILTGGAIVSMLIQDMPNDYDLYFRTRGLAFRVAQFFLWRFQIQSGSGMDMFIAYQSPNTEGKGDGQFGLTGWKRHYPTPENADELPGVDRFKIVIKSAGIVSSQPVDQQYEYFESRPDDAGVSWVDAVTQTDEVSNDTLEDPKEAESKGKHHPKFMSSNAITLAGKIQLITRFYGEPEQIHENYDFIHCTCFYKSWDKELVLPAAALEAILARELRYVGSLYPLCSIIRIRKFIARGWTINAGQILKMCLQVSDLDLRNLETLEDQLVGVDAAYFQAIISRLQTKQDEETTKLITDGMSPAEAKLKTDKIDTSYLMTIIDRIF